MIRSRPVLFLALLCSPAVWEGSIGIPKTSVAAEDPVVLPVIACTTTDDCPSDDDSFLDGNYCASDGTCTPIGSCAILDDCRSDDNKGYPRAACFGSLVCQETRCKMECTGTDALTTPKETATTCQTSDQCTGQEEYCSGDGTCREGGTCSSAEDCKSPENIYGIALCVGTTVCEEEQCGIVCGGAAPQGCETSDDCAGLEEYCSSDGTCREGGACASVEDCSSPDNVFATALCLGTTVCEEERCGIVCDGAAPDGAAAAPCETSDDCAGLEEYCSSDGSCREGGTCASAGDCESPDNVFASIECLGTTVCEEERCGIICGGVDEIGNTTGAPCSTSDDCDGASDYCSSGGTCLRVGECSTLGDCTNEDNGPYPVASCMGTLECAGNGMCAMDCTTEPIPALPAPGAEVSPPVIDQGGDGSSLPVDVSLVSCASDADCNVVSTTRLAGNSTGAAWPPPMYCAQGTCRKQGFCSTVEDCTNPSNNRWADKKCVGYLVCDAATSTCDRVCGSQWCPKGSRYTPCVVDPCIAAVEDVVPPGSPCLNSVSCRTTNCDGGCNALYYDASGTPIEKCDAPAPIPGETTSGTPITGTAADDKAKADPVSPEQQREPANTAEPGNAVDPVGAEASALVKDSGAAASSMVAALFGAAFLAFAVVA
eukprot:CAMPEP_0201142038 /NCGR_PEP_ID=MMETSP0851-20130426/3664_1 /ASSEMBLY_ACC=CAM_ASM_000631 /TAXON_ID=183588 /ORGANISM="Pseudo-nitzschia fraudulenta, Strain WWA7" /LENGTH=655 /DNA_ID=CAMNT_0047415479 /DNA_START=269 /DNA_END=2239 /DNA_ORIENTATION=+